MKGQKILKVTSILMIIGGVIGVVAGILAILGITASGFDDYEGNGTGGLPYGFLKSEGKTLQPAVGGTWKIIGFDEDGHLHVGAFSDTSILREAA